LGLAQPNPTLLGPVGQEDPTFLALFGSVLGLAVTLGLAAKLDPTTFGKQGNVPSRNS